MMGMRLENNNQFDVIIGGDKIEIEVEPRNVWNHEGQKKKGPVSETKKQNHMAENYDEQWIENWKWGWSGKQ